MTIPPGPPSPDEPQRSPSEESASNPVPPPPRSSSKGIVVIVLGVLLVLAIAGGTVLYLTVFKGTITASEVKAGDCLKELPDSGVVMTLRTVACEEPHAGEVFAVLIMPEGDFPGGPAIDAYTEKCGPVLDEYTNIGSADESVQLAALFPTAETWKQGDRAVTCIATLNPRRTGSIKG
jgi:hypothetical protein